MPVSDQHSTDDRNLLLQLLRDLEKLNSRVEILIEKLLSCQRERDTRTQATECRLKALEGTGQESMSVLKLLVKLFGVLLLAGVGGMIGKDITPLIKGLLVP